MSDPTSWAEAVATIAVSLGAFGLVGWILWLASKDER